MRDINEKNIDSILYLIKMYTLIVIKMRMIFISYLL